MVAVDGRWAWPVGARPRNSRAMRRALGAKAKKVGRNDTQMPCAPDGPERSAIAAAQEDHDTSEGRGCPRRVRLPMRAGRPRAGEWLTGRTSFMRIVGRHRGQEHPMATGCPALEMLKRNHNSAAIGCLESQLYTGRNGFTGTSPRRSASVSRRGRRPAPPRNTISFEAAIRRADRARGKWPASPGDRGDGDRDGANRSVSLPTSGDAAAGDLRAPAGACRC